MALKITWQYLLKNFSFFNQLFATYYPFTEKELSIFHSTISVGSPFMILGNGDIHLPTNFGLVYNDQIEWTEKLKDLYYEEPKVLWTGSGTDEYDFEIDFNNLPLSIKHEFDRNKGIANQVIISNWGYSDEDGYYDDLQDELDYSDQYYDGILTETEFSNSELENIVANNNNLYIANNAFYLAFIDRINHDISDFSIYRFYEKQLSSNILRESIMILKPETMNLNILNKTVMLIDTDYLNQSIEYNLKLYSKLYPDKTFEQIDLSRLLYYFALNARIQGPDNKIDVIFSYTLTSPYLEHCTPSDLTFDISGDGISIQNDLGLFNVRAFFADENETCSENFVNILREVYYSPIVSNVIMVADSPELNAKLNILEFADEKSLFMLKNYHESHIDVPIPYVKIVYPIAFAMGLSKVEI